MSIPSTIDMTNPWFSNARLLATIATWFDKACHAMLNDV
ncbi:hypothetical protein BSIN_2087 [Burkholderia singularis]|uniref:Uncharacterized protein n=1 Tax=Burkholderia singularis TaxID=1503053 RepID=A0A238H0M4_9BURK|nr:hypothetical protein BSIN_2087 [Burkholderia singularis]